jgi:hypothetical protein
MIENTMEVIKINRSGTIFLNGKSLGKVQEQCYPLLLLYIHELVEFYQQVMCAPHSCNQNQIFTNSKTISSQVNKKNNFEVHISSTGSNKHKAQHF